jgi:hypothetical protein
MRYYETLFYAAGWSPDPAALEGFVREVQRLARARGIEAEAVQPVCASDEVSPGPLTMLAVLGAEPGGWPGQPDGSGGLGQTDP